MDSRRDSRSDGISTAARERPTSGAATAFLLAASSELVAMGSQPQALLGEGWLKSTWILDDDPDGFDALALERHLPLKIFCKQPCWRQLKGKSMVSLVNSFTDATSKR